jgi:hypothetical protein
MRFWPTKRIWKRIGLGFVALVALLLLANGIMAWWTRSQLQNRVTAIRAAGNPASIAELAPKPIPDAENAAAVLRDLGPRLDAFSKEYGPFFDTPEGKAYEQRTDRGEKATPEQIAVIRAILDKYPEIDAKLSEAARRGKYASLTDYSVTSVKLLGAMLKEPIGQYRTAARFLAWRMEVLLADGKQQEVVQRGVEFFQLTRLYDQEPLMVNALVNVAVRNIIANQIYDALAAGPVSPELHAALDRQLALDDDPQRVVRVLKTEEAYSASAIDEFGWRLPVGDAPSVFVRMFGWSIQRHFLGVLDFYDVQLKLSARPWREVFKQVGREGSPDLNSFGTMSELLIPAVQSLYEAEMRSIAILRALRVFNAMTAFREQHGKEISGLSDLPLPKEAMIDPFSDKPLLLKRLPDGWVVYSVAKNGVDDGGSFVEIKDYGVAPSRHRAEESNVEPNANAASTEK